MGYNPPEKGAYGRIVGRGCRLALNHSGWGKWSSSQETSSNEVNPKPKRSKNPEDYPGYIREVLELNEEKDEAVQDAANANDKVEALTDRIKELKGKLSAIRSDNTSTNDNATLDLTLVPGLSLMNLGDRTTD
ncbi:unnamed protein product [Calypogeia fissa]